MILKKIVRHFFIRNFYGGLGMTFISDSQNIQNQSIIRLNNSMNRIAEESKFIYLNKVISKLNKLIKSELLSQFVINSLKDNVRNLFEGAIEHEMQFKRKIFFHKNIIDAILICEKLQIREKKLENYFQKQLLGYIEGIKLRDLVDLMSYFVGGSKLSELAYLTLMSCAFSQIKETVLEEKITENFSHSISSIMYFATISKYGKKTDIEYLCKELEKSHSAMSFRTICTLFYVYSNYSLKLNYFQHLFDEFWINVGDDNQKEKIEEFINLPFFQNEKVNKNINLSKRASLFLFCEGNIHDNLKRISLVLKGILYIFQKIQSFNKNTTNVDIRSKELWKENRILFEYLNLYANTALQQFSSYYKNQAQRSLDIKLIEEETLSLANILYYFTKIELLQKSFCRSGLLSLVIEELFDSIQRFQNGQCESDVNLFFTIIYSLKNWQNIEKILEKRLQSYPLKEKVEGIYLIIFRRLLNEFGELGISTRIRLIFELTTKIKKMEDWLKETDILAIVNCFLEIESGILELNDPDFYNFGFILTNKHFLKIILNFSYPEMEQNLFRTKIKRLQEIYLVALNNKQSNYPLQINQKAKIIRRQKEINKDFKNLFSDENNDLEEHSYI